MNSQMTFFDEALRLMTSFVSHGSLTVKGFAESLAPLFKQRLPLFGLSILVFHDRTQYRLGSYTSDAAYKFLEEIRFSDELLDLLRRERETLDMERSHIVRHDGNGAFSEAFREIYGPDMSCIFIPLGFFPHFPEFVYICVYNKGMPYTQQHVEYCDAIRGLLVFMMAVILKQEPLKFENGRIARRESDAPPDEQRPESRARTLDEHVIECILDSLRASRGRVAGKNGAAAMLGLNASTLWSKIRKYRIEMPKIAGKASSRNKKID